MTVALLVAVATNAVIFVALSRLVAVPVDVASIAPSAEGGPARARQGLDVEDAARLDFSGLDRNQVVARPLFTMGRRPWQPPAAPPESEPVAVAEPVATVAPEVENPPDILLLGIGIAKGGASALLTDANGTGPVWVAEGEMMGNWRVGEISDQSVTIERDSQAVSLRLYPAPSGE